MYRACCGPANLKRIMSVETFDPDSAKPTMTEDVLTRLLVAAGKLAAERFGLTPEEADRMAPLVRQDAADWRAAAGNLSDEDVVSLIRLFTLGEAVFPNWESGAKSPVIPLVGELKRRGTFPPELTRWIKANTGNRFLPYGSLMDRL